MYQAARLNLSAVPSARRSPFTGTAFLSIKYSYSSMRLRKVFPRVFISEKGIRSRFACPILPPRCSPFTRRTNWARRSILCIPTSRPKNCRRAPKRRTANSSSYTMPYPHAGEEKPAFGVPVLESDCGWFMGAAARAYYRMTNKKLGWGEKLEKLLKKKRGPSLPSVNFAQAEPGSLSRERRHHGRAEDHRPQQLYVQSSVFQGSRSFLSEPRKITFRSTTFCPFFTGSDYASICICA